MYIYIFIYTYRYVDVCAPDWLLFVSVFPDPLGPGLKSMEVETRSKVAWPWDGYKPSKPREAEPRQPNKAY